MTIKYVNSKGKEMNLNKEPYKMLISDLLDYEWEVSSSGNRIRGFGYAVKEKSLNIDVHRTKTAGARTNMNALSEFFEQDIINGVPGKLYLDDSYMNCYIKSSEKSNWETDQIISCEYGLITDYPFWITEKSFSFAPGTKGADSEFLDYLRGYDYDYFDPGKGVGRLDNDHYTDAHFNMIIYGPVVNPRILIGGYPYEVFTTVTKNEYLVIDSRARTVVRTKQGGEKIDEFDNRNKEQSIFRKIPAGSHTINWSGDFGIDITLFQERSEPRWT